MNSTHPPTLEERIAARFGPAKAVTPIAADASTRLFFRLKRPRGKSRIVMIDRQGGPDAVERMVEARKLLADIGVRVPKIEDGDNALPGLLLEDFGDQLLADALPHLPRDQQLQLYGEAGRIAGKISHLGTPKVHPDHPLALPLLNRRRLRLELALFVTQDVAGRRELRDPALFRDLARVLDRIVDEITREKPVLAHRDFHARNLLVLPGPKLGVVDFQDTLLAPPFYDLASLVRDPYVTPDEELAQAAALAFAKTSRFSGEPLDHPLFSWVALQRDLKAIGTYAFQSRVHKRTRFLASIPNAERLTLRAVEELPSEAGTVIQNILDRIGFS